MYVFTSFSDDGKAVEYADYAVHDFESTADPESNSTSAPIELEELEYPYNQEITHQAVWAPFDDYVVQQVPADVEPSAASVSQQPRVRAPVRGRGVHGNGEDWDPMGPMGFPWEWE